MRIHTLDQYFVQFLNNKSLETIIEAQCEATKNIFKLKKIPFRKINFEKGSEKELGEIFTFFENCRFFSGIND